MKKVLLLLFLVLLFVIFFLSKNALSSELAVISDYKGWLGNPESLKVYIDSTWTNAQKDSAKTAIDRWNDADGEPKLKVVKSPTVHTLQ